MEVDCEPVHTLAAFNVLASPGKISACSAAAYMPAVSEQESPQSSVFMVCEENDLLKKNDPRRIMPEAGQSFSFTSRFQPKVSKRIFLSSSPQLLRVHPIGASEVYNSRASSSSTQLKKRAVAQRISLIDSKTKSLCKHDSRLSSGLVMHSFRKRTAQLTQASCNTSPNSACFGGVSNNPEDSVVDMNNHLQIPGLQRAEELDQDVAKIVIPIPAQTGSKVALLTDRPSFKGSKRTHGCVKFKRERELSLRPNQGDTDEAAKLKAEDLQSKKLKNLQTGLASPLTNVVSTPSSGHLLRASSLAFLGNSKLGLGHKSSVVLHSYLSTEYRNQPALPDKSMDLQDVKKPVFAPKEVSIPRHNLGRLRQLMIQDQKMHLSGEVLSSLTISEKELGRVPSFALSKSNTINEKMSYTKKTTARPIQDQKCLQELQQGTQPMDERKPLLDSIPDLEECLMSHKSLLMRTQNLQNSPV